MGSSGKKRGAAAREATTDQAATTATTYRAVQRDLENTALKNTALKNTALKNIVEPEDEVPAVAAAECGFHAEEDTVRRPEPESDAVVGFQVLEVQVSDTRRNLAAVVEQRPVHGGEDLPTVLRLQQQRVPVSEAE